MTPWCKVVISQFGDLDFQGGDLLARSLGSDPPLLAAPGQVGKAVLVAFDGGLEVFVVALPPISVCTGYWLLATDYWLLTTGYCLRSLCLLFHPSRLMRKKRLKAPGRLV